jgi:hypothetical protein
VKANLGAAVAVRRCDIPTLHAVTSARQPTTRKPCPGEVHRGT